MVQGKRSNYDTDLFQNIIRRHREAGRQEVRRTPTRPTTSRCGSSPTTPAPPPSWSATACCPPTRGAATCCAASCGAPSGTGSGSGSSRLFLAEVCGAVIAEMGDAYPEIREQPRLHPSRWPQQEEESFRRTLDKGLAILEEEMRAPRPGRREDHPGQGGLPALRHLRLPHGPHPGHRRGARGSASTRPASRPPWREQRARSRVEGLGRGGGGRAAQGRSPPSSARPASSATRPTAAKARCIALVVNGARAARARQGRPGRGDHRGDPVLRRVGRPGGRHRRASPAPRGQVKVTDAQRPVPGLVTHRGEVAEGELAVGDRVELHGRRGAARPDPRQPLGHPPAPPGAARAAGRARQAGRLGGGARPPALRLLPLPAAHRRGAPRRRAPGQRPGPPERAGRHRRCWRSRRPARPAP